MLVWVHHLGWGDALCEAALAVKYAKQEGGLVYPCYHEYFRGIRQLFANVPEIIPVRVEKDWEMLELATPNKQAVCLGFYEHTGVICGWYPPDHRMVGRGIRGINGYDEWFYRQCGEPISLKYDGFPIKEWPAYNPAWKGTVFVHEDDHRGFIIDRKYLPEGAVVPDFGCLAPKDKTLLDHAEQIISCDEIHVIDSSFLNLAEQLPLRPEQPKFLHAYARDSWLPFLRHNWTILE